MASSKAFLVLFVLFAVTLLVSSRELSDNEAAVTTEHEQPKETVMAEGVQHVDAGDVGTVEDANTAGVEGASAKGKEKLTKCCPCKGCPPYKHCGCCKCW